MVDSDEHRTGSASSSPEDHQQEGFWRKLWLIAKTVQARLRFIVVLAVVGGLIANWDTLTSYYEKWTRHTGKAEVASSDIEYFCPMHLFIVRDNSKEKCPICHMDLARRKKGSDEAEPLPAGTVSRVQLSPYRIVLAGIQTVPAQYLPLVKEITTYGSVEFNETKQAQITARQKGRIEKLYVNFTGQTVDQGEKLALLDVRYSPELTVTLQDLLRARENGNREAEESARKRLRLWDINEAQLTELIGSGTVKTKLTITSPIHGHVIKKYQREGNFVDEGMPLYDVADLDSVWIEAQFYEADQALLKEKQTVTATTLSLPEEEFTGTVSFIAPHLDENTRTLRVRFEIPNPGHKLRPGMYASVKVTVPPQQIDLLARTAAQDAERQTELRQNRVLAVPENAVIDTGKLKIVYREVANSSYEGVAVQLGPRMTDDKGAQVFYPVLSGLKAGERVVTNGSFLVDAETRLNPAAGSIYSGGSSGGKGASPTAPVRPSTPSDGSDPETKARAELAKLGAEDRRLAEAQKTCPVTNEPLGSMGVPVKLTLKNQPVFLCCRGCESEAKTEPDRILARVQALKAKSKASQGRDQRRNQQ
jgi:Cu(I)/Ag(I) efflux system membrane fusion protein